MHESERQLTKRTQEIITRRDELMPFFRVGKALTQDQISELLSDETLAREAVSDGLRSMLTSYGLTFHATLTDRMHRKEELACESEDRLIFVEPSEEPGYLHYVGMEWQKSKLNGREELTCKNVGYCLAPSKGIRELTDKPMRLKELSEEYIEVSVPESPKEIIFFEFDEKGKPGSFYYGEEVDQKIIPRMQRYNVTGNNFTVTEYLRRTPSDVWFKKGAHDYLFLKDKRFFRMPVDDKSVPIQEEVASILAKLPMDLLAISGAQEDSLDLQGFQPVSSAACLSLTQPNGLQRLLGKLRRK